MRSYPVKENHIGSVVSMILGTNINTNRQTNRVTSCYFITNLNARNFHVQRLAHKIKCVLKYFQYSGFPAFTWCYRVRGRWSTRFIWDRSWVLGQMRQKFTDDRTTWSLHSSEWFEVSPRTDITHETDANQKEKHFIALLHFWKKFRELKYFILKQGCQHP